MVPAHGRATGFKKIRHLTEKMEIGIFRQVTEWSLGGLKNPSSQKQRRVGKWRFGYSLVASASFPLNGRTGEVSPALTQTK
jgi:hypothetical protein